MMSTLQVTQTEKGEDEYTLEDVKTWWELECGKYGEKFGTGMEWETEDTETLYQFVLRLEPELHSNIDGGMGSGSGLTQEDWEVFFHQFEPEALEGLVTKMCQENDVFSEKIYPALWEKVEDSLDAVGGLCNLKNLPDSFVLNKVIPRLEEYDEWNGETLAILVKNPHVSEVVVEKVEEVAYSIIDNAFTHGKNENKWVAESYYETISHVLAHSRITQKLIDKYMKLVNRGENSGVSFAADVYRNPVLSQQFVVEKFEQVYNDLEKIHKYSVNKSDIVHLKTLTILNSLVLNPNLPQKFAIQYLDPENNVTKHPIMSARDSLYEKVSLPEEVCKIYGMKMVEQGNLWGVSFLLRNSGMTKQVGEQIVEVVGGKFQNVQLSEDKRIAVSYIQNQVAQLT